MKTIDEQLQEALERQKKLEKEKSGLLEKIRKNDEVIKKLNIKKKQITDEAVIKRIEAAGFTVDDVLQMMSEKYTGEAGKLNEEE